METEDKMNSLNFPIQITVENVLMAYLEPH